MSNARRATAADERLRLNFSGLVAFFKRLRDRIAGLNNPDNEPSRRIETVLRRSIPILILAFLSVVAIARVAGILGEHARMENSVRQTTVLVATAANAALEGREALFVEGDRAAAEAALSALLPADRMSGGSFVLMVEPSGRVFASSSAGAGYVGLPLANLLPHVATIRRFADLGGGIETDIGGERHFAVLTPVGTDGALFLTAHSLQQTMDFWRSEIALNVTLFSGISLILSVILYAYFQQVKRARDADEIFLESNMRVEAALSRGRCGLWDFDLANRKLFWSRSMYEMLGLPPSGDVMAFGDAARLMHPDDGNLFALARAVGRGKSKQIDQIFRMRHAHGHYVWMRARAQVICSSTGCMHVIGIAMDVTEQHRLAQRYAEADQRL
ncbi:MAG: PAS domain-containing protein, partial [Rhizobium sp.]|nr:PAS domain-containing protein [Rhizobium sp.]